MPVYLALLALVSLLLPIGHAAERDSWMQIGTVDRTNVYTTVLRNGHCERGYIGKVESASVTIETDLPRTRTKASSPQSVQIPRSEVLRIGQAIAIHEVIYSARSSWADVQASRVGAREHLMVVLNSGRQTNAAPISVSSSGLTFKSGPKQVAIAKTDVSKVFYVRFKPLPAGYEWVAQEAPFLVLFSPKTWQNALKIDAMMSVLLYDSAVPEDDSPLSCPTR